MATKPLLVTLAVLMEIFCFVVLIESELRKRPQGEKLLDAIENRTVRFTNWRANADIKDELERIRRVFGWGLGVLILLLFLAATFHLPWMAIFLFPFFTISFFGYLSLEWTINWRSIFKFYSLLFLILIPSIIYAYAAPLPEYQKLANLSVHFAQIFGMTKPEPSLTLTICVSAGVFLFLFSLMTIIAALVSLGIFTPLWLTAKISIFFKRRFNKNVLWWTACAAQIIVIILGGIINLL